MDKNIGLAQPGRLVRSERDGMDYMYYSLHMNTKDTLIYFPYVPQAIAIQQPNETIEDAAKRAMARHDGKVEASFCGKPYHPGDFDLEGDNLVPFTAGEKMLFDKAHYHTFAIGLSTYVIFAFMGASCVDIVQRGESIPNAARRIYGAWERARAIRGERVTRPEPESQPVAPAITYEKISPLILCNIIERTYDDATTEIAFKFKKGTERADMMRYLQTISERDTGHLVGIVTIAPPPPAPKPPTQEEVVTAFTPAKVLAWLMTQPMDATHTHPANNYAGILSRYLAAQFPICSTAPSSDDVYVGEMTYRVLDTRCKHRLAWIEKFLQQFYDKDTTTTKEAIAVLVGVLSDLAEKAV